MTVLNTRVDKHSAEFQENYQALAKEVEALRNKSEEIAQGGGEKARGYLHRSRALARLRERQIAVPAERRVRAAGRDRARSQSRLKAYSRCHACAAYRSAHG